MTLEQQNLNQIMNEETFKEIIKKAKELSKKQFLLFATKTLGTNEDTWDKLWKIPVISSYEGDTLINHELSEERENEVLALIDSTIDEQLYNAEAVTIPFTYFDTILDAIKSEEYSEAIFYSKKNIMNMLKKRLNCDENDIKRIVTSELAKIITHETCHANSIYRIDEGIEDEVTTIYGARGTFDSYEDVDLQNFYEEQDEVLNDTIALMIMRCREGDSIEDCLLKVIKERNGKNTYDDFDDRRVLLLMTLFPKELTEWVMLGAHGNSYHNLLEEKEKEVFGEHPEFARNLERTVCNYFNDMDKSQLTPEQLVKRIKMLELMGVKKENIIKLEEIKDLAESEEAMKNLNSGASVIKALVNDKRNEKSIEE